MPSKSSKFGGIIFLYHRVTMVRAFVLPCIVEFRLKQLKQKPSYVLKWLCDEFKVLKNL